MFDCAGLPRIPGWSGRTRLRFKVYDVFEGVVGTPDIEPPVHDYIRASASIFTDTAQ